MNALAVDYSNAWFASGSSDGAIRAWDLVTGQLKFTFGGSAGREGTAIQMSGSLTDAGSDGSSAANRLNARIDELEKQLKRVGKSAGRAAPAAAAESDDDHVRPRRLHECAIRPHPGPDEQHDQTGETQHRGCRPASWSGSPRRWSSQRSEARSRAIG